MNNCWGFVHSAFPVYLPAENVYPIQNEIVFYPLQPIQFKTQEVDNSFFSGPNFNLLQHKLDLTPPEQRKQANIQSCQQTSNKKQTKSNRKFEKSKKSSCKSEPEEFNCGQSLEEMGQTKKRSWSQKQEMRLKQLVGLFGQQWKQICQYFPNRNPKQIRQRYLNYLRPNLTCEKWTAQEDIKLIQCMKQCGRCWKVIEKKIKNRSQNQIKNRYYGHLKKIMDKQSPKDVQNQ